MDKNTCPICGSTQCIIEELSAKSHALRIKCNRLDARFYLDTEVYELNNDILWFRLMNIITQFLIRRKFYQSAIEKLDWYFINKEVASSSEIDAPQCINLADELKLYPTTIIGRISSALLNLSILYPNVGEHIFLESFDSFSNRTMFCESNMHAYELETVCRYLLDLNFIDGDWRDSFITISYRGWEKIEELRSRLNEVDQGFIAMSYSQEAKYIMDAFREAILSSGYKAQIMSEKEHNQQIVPEMFYEIERSKFMVVDVTYPNYGAYYEAGYAQALGKEVIVCCNESTYNEQKLKPHFDIAQKPIIIWKDTDELIQRLKRRIEATVH